SLLPVYVNLALNPVSVLNLPIVRAPGAPAKKQPHRVLVSFARHGALPGAVIPAKAGIHSASHWKYAADGLDSRLRGNDRCFERVPIPNDTTTPHRNIARSNFHPFLQ